jgi:hypothetical protein
MRAQVPHGKQLCSYSAPCFTLSSDHKLSGIIDHPFGLPHQCHRLVMGSFRQGAQPHASALQTKNSNASLACWRRPADRPAELHSLLSVAFRYIKCSIEGGEERGGEGY